MVTVSPRASRMAASDAAAMPLPSEDTTPPVTKIRGVMEQVRAWKVILYRLVKAPASAPRGNPCTVPFRNALPPCAPPCAPPESPPASCRPPILTCPNTCRRAGRHGEWLSGFTGSAGTLVVTADVAGLWTDSRYFEQAGRELDGNGITLMRLSACRMRRNTWTGCAGTLRTGSGVAVAGDSISVAAHRALAARLDEHGVHLRLDLDLPAQVWSDRPALPAAPIRPHPAAFACASRRERLGRGARGDARSRSDASPGQQPRRHRLADPAARRRCRIQPGVRRPSAAERKRCHAVRAGRQDRRRTGRRACRRRHRAIADYDALASALDRPAARRAAAARSRAYRRGARRGDSGNGAAHRTRQPVHGLQGAQVGRRARSLARGDAPRRRGTGARLSQDRRTRCAPASA